jgi:8-oxo-dGTP pyrophosphatase MutT (NUDIX family)
MKPRFVEKRGPFDVISRELIYKNHWLRLEHDRVHNTLSGQDSSFTVVRYQNNAVAVLPIDDKGNLYLCKEFKYAINKDVIQAPGGFMEVGETPIVSAKRELEEELGIIASSWEDCGTVYCYGSVNEACYTLFIARNLTFSKPKLDDSESIELVKVPLPAAYEMLKAGEIIAAPSTILIQRAILESSGI